MGVESCESVTEQGYAGLPDHTTNAGRLPAFVALVFSDSSSDQQFTHFAAARVKVDGSSIPPCVTASAMHTPAVLLPGR